MCMFLQIFLAFYIQEEYHINPEISILQQDFLGAASACRKVTHYYKNRVMILKIRRLSTEIIEKNIAFCTYMWYCYI